MQEDRLARRVPVWWKHSGGQAVNATLLPHNRIAWAIRHNELLSTRSRPFEVHRLDGTRTATVETPDVVSDWHELRPLPNGHFLILGDKRRDHVNLAAYGGPRDATVLDGIAEEVTGTGRVVWKWNSARHIGIAESGRWLSYYVFKNRVVLPDGQPPELIAHFVPGGRCGTIRHPDLLHASRSSLRPSHSTDNSPTTTNKSVANSIGLPALS